MKERPILFSAPMVRAILEGRKTQTRRVVKPQPDGVFTVGVYNPTRVDRKGEEYPGDEVFGAYHVDGEWGIKCPYGKPGDRLWVRETWRPRVSANGLSRGVEYRADGRMNLSEMPSGIFNEVSGFIPLHLWAPGQHAEMTAFCDRWRPSIHMPRWASRITLEVVSVRVERVNSITESDARAEGITDGGCLSCGESEPCGCNNPQPSPRDSFAWLWNEINGKEAWSENPWVWVVEFKKVGGT